MTLVFVSYRWIDAAYQAADCAAHLADLFGEDRVFLDHARMTPGSEYPAALEDAVEKAAVLVVLIGPRWLEREGRLRTARRIDDPRDWVRREIARALERGIPIVPVLLEDTPGPTPADLPAPVAGLALRQYGRLRVRSATADLADLAEAVRAGAPGLLLRRLFAGALPAVQPALPSTLLRPERAVVDFAGRETERAVLRDWASGPGVLSARLLVGPAGQGKTRLALHLAESLRAHGWSAGLVADDLTGATLARVAALDVPLLLVVDRAEGRSAQVGELAAAVADRAPGRPPIRFLLLARAMGVWAAPLRQATDERVLSLFAGSVEQRLGALAGAGHARRAEYGRAVAAFTAALGAAPGPRDPPVDLDSPRYGSALGVHMAALAAVLGDRAGATADPLQVVLAHEAQYWLDTSPHPDPTRSAEVVATATLFGGGRDDLRRVLAALPDVVPGTVGAHLDWVTGLYPAGLGPDLLAEALVADVLARHPDLAAPAAAAAGPDQLRRAFVLLARAADRRPGTARVLDTLLADAPEQRLSPAVDAATELAEPAPLLRSMTPMIGKVETVAELAELVIDRLPDSAYGLARFAVDVLRTAVEAAADPADAAYLYANLAARLGVLGEWTDAVAAADAAVAEYEQLPGTYAPHLAAALSNRALMQLELGAYEDAERTATRALALLSGPGVLAAAGPRGAIKSGLVLAEAFGRSGRPERQREILDLLARTVATMNDDDMLGAVLEQRALALPDNRTAVGSMGRAVELYRALSADRPDPYRSRLAQGLVNLAVLRLDGDPAGAVADAAEAVELARGLVRWHGERERPLLARAEACLDRARRRT